jgi:hypothetical protein
VDGSSGSSSSWSKLYSSSSIKMLKEKLECGSFIPQLHSFEAHAGQKTAY